MKKKIVTAIVALTVLAGCASRYSVAMKTESAEVIDYCLREAAKLTGNPLSLEADQAYLYVEDEGYWVNFTHGALGTFGERSLDYSVVLSCAVWKNPRKLVYLGEPLEDPVVNEPESESFVDPVGAIEVLLKRKGMNFRYCCEQPFDEKRIEENNPDFRWRLDKIGA